MGDDGSRNQHSLADALTCATGTFIREGAALTAAFVPISQPLTRTALRAGKHCLFASKSATLHTTGYYNQITIAGILERAPRRFYAHRQLPKLHHAVKLCRYKRCKYLQTVSLDIRYMTRVGKFRSSLFDLHVTSALRHFVFAAFATTASSASAIRGILMSCCAGLRTA